jgi:hypothetical protein
MPEIKDIPKSMKIIVACAGSMIGAEDCMTRGQYSCTVTCKTKTGLLYSMAKDVFENMQN